MKTETIHIRPGLSLYKQPLTGHSGSRFWYARVRMKLDGRGVQVKSSRTTDVDEAKRFADTYFGQCLMRHQYPEFVDPSATEVPQCRRFDMVADKWLDQR